VTTKIMCAKDYISNCVVPSTTYNQNNPHSYATSMFWDTVVWCWMWLKNFTICSFCIDTWIVVVENLFSV